MNEKVENTGKLPEQSEVYHDLDHLIGTWEEDSDFNQAMEMQRYIEPDLW